MPNQPELCIDFVWEDVDIEEVRISASNEAFCGSTQIYIAPGELAALSETLKGFPKSIEQQELFTAGAENGYAFASLLFHCLDGVGHTGVAVTLEEPRSGTRDRVVLELHFEPNALDQFCDQLLSVSRRVSARAVLKGLK